MKLCIVRAGSILRTRPGRCLPLDRVLLQFPEADKRSLARFADLGLMLGLEFLVKRSHAQGVVAVSPAVATATSRRLMASMSSAPAANSTESSSMCCCRVLVP